MNAKQTALDACLARTTASGPIASPDCKPPKGLRTPQALFFGQIPGGPFCRFSALESAENRASTGWNP